jgi:hypothetical protein
LTHFRTQDRIAILAGTAMSLALLLGGCTSTTENVYDPGHSDYHKWDKAEDSHYHQWVNDTHHSTVEYKKLPPEDQKSYWDWRHSWH